MFLHGMWRSGSTFVWSCFRKNPQTLCFYEPLHEGMGRLSAARIRRQGEEVGRDLRHPPLERPYFAEYAPLLARRGVRRFHPDFSRERFVLGADDRHRRLRAYVGSLVAHAWAQGRTPVLGFNRSNLRMPWLDQAFAPYNLYVERDPEEIWASYADHAARGNFSFLQNWLRIVERNRADPLLAPIAQRLPLRRSVAERLRKPKPHYAEAIRRMAPQDAYLLVHYLWLVSLIQAVAHCPLVFDVSAAGRGGATADHTSAAVKAATGLAVDFGGCDAPRPRTRLPAQLRQELHETALSLLPPAALAPLAGPLLADLTLLTPEKLALVRGLQRQARAGLQVEHRFADRPIRTFAGEPLPTPGLRD